MAALNDPDLFLMAVLMDAFRHRTGASIQMLLRELDERGVTIDPESGQVTITTRPEPQDTPEGTTFPCEQ